jgi:aspartyl/asparaginyl beta-hydroxylase (cupin superfamily)
VTRRWTRGELLMFDDSYEHEAWNRGPSPRAVLIFDAWRPDLSAAERAALEESIAAIDAANALRAPGAAA